MISRGFTLLEVLVALTVLGLILAGLGQGAAFGLRAWGTQAAAVNAYADLDGADRIIRQLVAQMDPGMDGDPPVSAGPASLAFRTNLGAAAAALGVYDADIALLADHGNLVMRWTPALHGARIGPPPPPQTVLLAPGVARVDFAYWQPDGGGSWQSVWRGEGLPPLVRIRLVPTGRRRWPDIVAPPMRSRPLY